MKHRSADPWPQTTVQLNHPTRLPLRSKLHHFEQHPQEGPAVTLLSGGSGARDLSGCLTRYTHNSCHILPMFDDGGSSRVLRRRLKMPPPGDLRNRLLALTDGSDPSSRKIRELFDTRLPLDLDNRRLQEMLDAYTRGDHPLVRAIGQPFRKIIIHHLRSFDACQKRTGFELAGGNIGNFVLAGAYDHLDDLESVIFDFQVLAGARGRVIPVCRGSRFHLRAEFVNGTVCVGQSRITTEEHEPIRRLSIVEQSDDGAVRPASPPLNPRAEQAIRESELVAYTMGSFYTSLLATTLVKGTGRAIRLTRRPKILVANLTRDRETPDMTVGGMLRRLWDTLRDSDDQPGPMNNYLHYVLVGEHGHSDRDGRMPVDLPAIRDLGVEPIVLPVERRRDDGVLVHDPELVTHTLLSLC